MLESPFYGNFGDADRPEELSDGYPLAAWIWGHRLTTGQHWMEYMLEFLNVLAGFEYRLGQGLSPGRGDAEYLSGYKRFARFGLRRFVFYDESEKAKDEKNTAATTLLWERLRAQVVAQQDEGDLPLHLAQNLLRSFSAVEDARSWYAKALFPAHHNLLFWQGDRNTSAGNDPDATVTFSKRNFFARGGEIYYLLISAGTEQDREQRAGIETRLRTLLNGHNGAIGHLADLIDAAWRDRENGDPAGAGGDRATLGWVPDPRCGLYGLMAEDLATFLQNDLDSLESLSLLAHLIGFHIVQLLYHRACAPSDQTEHAGDGCLLACRPRLLIDALPEDAGGEIRKASASLFRWHEFRQEVTAKEFVRRHVDLLVGDRTGIDGDGLDALERLDRYFNLKPKTPFTTRRQVLLDRFTRGEIDGPRFRAQYADMLFKQLEGHFRKNFLGVHSKVARGSGLAAPRRGPGRYVLGDSLLKTLVLSNVRPGAQMPFGQFLGRLYDRYGIVVGPGEARASGLFDMNRINAEYYDRNRVSLLAKMRSAGLVTEYSDATALVTNQRESAE